MKSRTWMWTIVVSLFAVLAMPAWTAAQDNPSQPHQPKHHAYKLIDMGTFGGPASEKLPAIHRLFACCAADSRLLDQFEAVNRGQS